MKKLYAVGKRYPWSSVRAGNVPLSDSAMMKIRCVGFMPVFANKKEAIKFGGRGNIIEFERRTDRTTNNGRG